eukprot:CAMPEP_0204070892 /NCGR_PEP_ID=MMETSP0360-20130528/159216_1 /ASSEMBLY_ACC=CAM_ASM_000342 /TAXON_ID=268821 /ORGANISM="Scrippsiella Hangoei, Strain SHTV-5" /LENGTH=30 /DNA_ID= /DNA_START= /DNA_END= /DNA_ORIENTATION=
MRMFVDVGVPTDAALGSCSEFAMSRAGATQ